MEYRPPMVPLPMPALECESIPGRKFFGQRHPPPSTISWQDWPGAKPATMEETMLTDKLEKRYVKIRKRLSKLLAKAAALTPAEERLWNRLEAELCDVERKLLMSSPVFAN